MAFVGILSQIKLLVDPLLSYSACVVYTKTIIHLIVGESAGVYLAASRLDKYPPQFTSTPVNNC